MTLDQKEQEIIDEFAIYDDWMDKYEYIIELGKELPIIDDQKKTEDRLIDGCQSRVWLDVAVENNKMLFTADSDAIITKGIIALLIRVFNNESPKEVATADLRFIAEIGLHEHLSPTRSNGLASMIKKMKLKALKAV
ncbi:MAG: SufE family protein [Crocinitomicaceae bacterium]|jgi:cysteine desulfuration protein SufE|nr:SufE family protein [Crocinitomicaceae bacterium]MDA9169005.1 SufE family protein [Crocinitomicaceae bacterium]MDG1037014.1 SufE family protein [Crocinitomicaceae bacterium]MDG1741352.1 SufE family protein [Crocinitomicaceae bacterium]